MSDGNQPPDLPLPEAAIKAAVEAVRWRYGGLTDAMVDGRLQDDVRVVLEAAAPVLRAQGAAAEREREFVLVWRDERGDEICRSTPLRPGTTRIAIPIAAFCADHLLGGAVSDGEPPLQPHPTITEGTP